MSLLDGYHITDKIYESNSSLIFHAYRKSDDLPVIIKFLKKEFPTTSEISRFKQEYEMTSEINSGGVIKAYGFEKYKSSFAMIMEDVGGVSLRSQLRERRLSVGEFLHLALAITDILGEIHKQNIMHKDINPSNIIWNPEKDLVKLIDFGISSYLTHEKKPLAHTSVLQGTLSYMSPEQTGRMNRSVDYRTDFYSLGVTFYQMLTERLPFEAVDSMEMVHSHIARTAIVPSQLDRNIPDVVSDIVMKLMAHTAEDRYQSAIGLREDLNFALGQLGEKERIEYFEIGRHDISDKFQIPKRLYGREEEIKQLLGAYEAGSFGETQLMMLQGHTGIGKSALVQELQKSILKNRGYFVTGKFDQYSHNVPYSAFIEAVKELVRHILTEKEDVIWHWKNKLRKALGKNGRIIVDIIPEMEFIIGPQAELTKASAHEARTRFHMVFQDFILAFADEERPLAIFLDDLHWADESSLDLILILLSGNNTRFLFLIGAYDENLLEESGLLKNALKEILANEKVRAMKLGPLKLQNVNGLLSEVLKTEPAITRELAEICMEKTYGNPFFLNQFLYTLHEQKLLFFNSGIGRWQWDVDLISQKLDMTDNVLDLMSAKLQRLPEKTQNVLKLAACIGNSFELYTLAVVYKKSPASTAEDLWLAIQDGLVLPIVESHNLLRDLDVEVEDVNITYRFLHDRVQQAAYALIKDEDKKEVHLIIGRLLYDSIIEGKIEGKVFDVANQVNQGADLITDPIEGRYFAFLNLSAGKKAKHSAALVPSFNYLMSGIQLLGADSWESMYRLTLDLHVEAAESAFLIGKFNDMNRLINSVMTHARTLLDKIKVYEVKIEAETAQEQLEDAIATGNMVLRLLGSGLPKKPGKLRTLFVYARTRLLLMAKTPESLLSGEPMNDPFRQAEIRILAIMSSVSYFIQPKLVPIIVCRGIQLTAEFGVDESSPLIMTGYSVLLAGLLGKIEEGFEFGQKALTAPSISKDDPYEAKIYSVFYTLVAHWKEPIRNSLSPLLENFRRSLERNNMEFAAHSSFVYCYHGFHCGVELVQLEGEFTKYIGTCKKLNQETTSQMMEMFKEALGGLTGRDGSALLPDKAQESLPLPGITVREQRVLFTFQYTRMVLLYYFERYEEALVCAREAEKLVFSVFSSLLVPYLAFYGALIRLALLSQPNYSKRKSAIQMVEAVLRKFKKWVLHSPENYRNKYFLVLAEKYRVEGEEAAAAKAYTQAIELARKNDFVNEEALSYKLAAGFWMNSGQEELAHIYFRKTHHLFGLWGAKALVDILEKKYSSLLRGTKTRFLSSELPMGDMRHSISSISMPGGIASESLDLSTVMKGSQAISGEIKLGSFLEKMLHIVMENAGANRGVLILEENETLMIEAEARVTETLQFEIHSKPLEESNLLASSIVYYVARTKQNVVLNDAGLSEEFTADPYIIENSPKSLLCVPILHQGSLNAILYLENNLNKGVFTKERLEILRLLSSQIAISIDHARLYANLEGKVAERTVELREARDALWGEMQLAQKVQTVLLPTTPEVRGFEALGFMEPADEVGGDYYDFIQTENRDWVFIGDVSGHGVSAGLVMMMIQSSIQVSIRNEPDISPKVLLERINLGISPNLKLMKELFYMTITALAIREDGTVVHGGQHQKILVYRAEQKLVEVVETNGVWLGIDWDIGRPSENYEFKMYSGDVMLLYTDGITEASDGKGGIYTELRLQEDFEALGELSLEEIKMSLLSALTEFNARDDITLVLLRKN